jgi:hypothetical protein
MNLLGTPSIKGKGRGKKRITPSCLSFGPSSALHQRLHTNSMRPLMRLEDRPKSGAINPAQLGILLFFRGPKVSGA